MNEISVLEQALRTYGISGVVVVGTFWLAYKLVIHLLARDKDRDKMLTTSFDNSTSAMRDSSVAKERLAQAIDELIRAQDRQILQNRDEHGEILDFVRKGR